MWGLQAQLRAHAARLAAGTSVSIYKSKYDADTRQHVWFKFLYARFEGPLVPGVPANTRLESGM